MIKRWIAGMLGAAVIAGGPLTAAAAEISAPETALPFVLEAPSHVSLVWWEGGDTLTTMQADYSMNDSMCQWLGKYSDSKTKEETLKALRESTGFSDLSVAAQIDWAIDDPEKGWHYTAFWDGDDTHGIGVDADGVARVSSWDTLNGWADPKTVNEMWILRSGEVNPDAPGEESAWFYGSGLTPGVQQQLTEDQYSFLDHEEEDTSTKNLFIDYSVHTAYVRVRWAVTASLPSDSGETKQYFFSDWSSPAAYGKEGSETEPLTKETLPAPDISGLRYAEEEFGGFPQLVCTLTVPDSLATAITRIRSADGVVRVQWEVRLPGEEWQELTGGSSATTGDMTIALLELGTALQERSGSPTLRIGTPIELRARYLCQQNTSLTGTVLPDILSDYSAVLSIAAEESVSSAVIVSEVSAQSAPAPEESPSPSGMPLWGWLTLGGGLIAAGAAVIFLGRRNAAANTKTKSKKK